MFFSIVIFIVPVTMILLYPYFLKLASGPIRSATGFRTQLSKKSKENWELGNRYAGKLSLIVGLVLLIVSIVLVSQTVLTEKMVLFLSLFQIIVVNGVTVATQYKLKRYEASKNDI